MEKLHRLIPCPAYEVKTMEDWLADMAGEGLLLEKDGFFLGFAGFERSEPQTVRYRLLPVQKSGEEPDDDQLRLCEKYGWEYVARRRDFYVFRSFDPDARELNTDASVEAYALRPVKKRQRSALISSLFYLLVYPLLVTRFCPLLTAVALGSFWTLMAFVWGLCMVIRELKAFRYLKALQSTLRESGSVPAPDWRKSRSHYLSARLFTFLLGLFLIVSFIGKRTDAVPLSQYEGALPFATMADLASEGSRDYRLTMSSISGSINTVEERSDFLAPLAVTYNEHATVKTAEGRMLDGGLYVEYIELRSPRLAEEALRELYRIDRFRHRYTPMEAPELDCDEVRAYMDNTHFPNLLIRKGNVAARVMFYQTSEYKVPLEDWAAIVCDRLGA